MRLALVGGTSLLGCALAVSGCASNNPVQAAADVVAQGTTAGANATLDNALQLAQRDVTEYRVENSALPSAAQFQQLPDVTMAGKNASLTYHPTATGYCVAATTLTAPAVTRYATESAVLPAGQSC